MRGKLVRSGQKSELIATEVTESVIELVITRILKALVMSLVFGMILFLLLCLKLEYLKDADETGAYCVTAAIFLVVALVSIRPKWRESASAGMGGVLAVLAWSTALFADFTDAHSFEITFALVMSTCFSGLAYILVFRPMGAREREKGLLTRRADQEERLRQAIREEIRSFAELTVDRHSDSVSGHVRRSETPPRLATHDAD